MRSTASSAASVALFGHIAALVSSGDSLDSVLDAVVDLVHEVMKVERCSILLSDERAPSKLVLAAATGMPDAPVAQRTPVTESVAGDVFAEGRPRLGHAKPPEGEDSRYSTNTYISCPIPHDGRTIGVINITNRRDRRPFDQDDVALLQAVSGVVGVAIGRARLQARMNSMRNRLERILDGLPMGVLLCDAEDHISHANLRASELARIPAFHDGLPLDAPEHGAAGAILSPLLHDARKRRIRVAREWTPSVLPPEAVSAQLARALDNPEQPVTISSHIVPEDDPPRPLRLSVEFLGDSGEALILLEDITMNQAVHELRRLDEMKTNFISLVSHELRTPLTSLRGAVSLLTTFYGEGLSDTHKDLLRIVGTSCERLGSIVNMIIDTAMIDQDQLLLEHHAVPFERIVKRLVDARAKDFEAKQLTARVEFSTKGGLIEADEERLGQAIGAVLDNAIKYARPHTPVLVRLWLDMEGTFRLRIRNLGEPIPPESREKVFERFFQIENTLTRGQGGAGLGLYLARQITILHGGLLELIDDQDGATFEFVLPSA